LLSAGLSATPPRKNKMKKAYAVKMKFHSVGVTVVINYRTETAEQAKSMAKAWFPGCEILSVTELPENAA
jgi:hypothetical protein